MHECRLTLDYRDSITQLTQREVVGLTLFGPYYEEWHFQDLNPGLLLHKGQRHILGVI
jgi:hypothetical protein